MVTESWIADYEAITTASGVIALADWSQIQLIGNDRVKFLHNMCTNDIRRLEPGQMCETFLLDVKGKIVAHVQIIAGTNELTLLTVPGQGERIIKHLDRYIIREDVQLTDVSGEFDWHLVVGPRTAENSFDGTTWAAKCDLLWPGGSLVRTTKSDKSALAGIPAVDTSSPGWTALRTESFFPLYGTDFGESHLPQEINRDIAAISFNKGCYLGQETVARIDALGHVNKKLVLVKFEGEQIPSVGTKLTNDGQEVGTVTTGSWSPRFAASLAIAFVRRGSNDTASKLQSAYGGAEVIQPTSGIS